MERVISRGPRDRPAFGYPSLTRRKSEGHVYPRKITFLARNGKQSSGKGNVVLFQLLVVIVDRRGYGFFLLLLLLFLLLFVLFVLFLLFVFVGVVPPLPPLVPADEIRDLFAGFRSDPETEAETQGALRNLEAPPPLSISARAGDLYLGSVDMEQRYSFRSSSSRQSKELQAREALEEHPTKQLASFASLHPWQRRELQAREAQPSPLEQLASTASLDPWQRQELQAREAPKSPLEQPSSFASLDQWQRGEPQAREAHEDSLQRFDQAHMPNHRQRRELRGQAAENAFARIDKEHTGRAQRVTLSTSQLSHSELSALDSNRPTGPTIHHIPTEGSAPQTSLCINSAGIPQDPISLKKISLKFASYNIRGLKRIGRHCELSHLLVQNHFDIMGIQETKCSGNTVTPLADGFLFNSSNEIIPNRPEHRGTGIIISKELAPSIRVTYQGSSRWCGIVLLATPVPLLALSVYAPTKNKRGGRYTKKTNVLPRNWGDHRGKRRGLCSHHGRLQCPTAYGPGITQTHRTKYLPYHPTSGRTIG